MRKADCWGVIYEDPKTHKLGWAIVEVEDVFTLSEEAHRLVARGAVSRTLGWVHLMAPAEEMDMPEGTKPTKVFVGSLDAAPPAGLRSVFVNNVEKVRFRLTPSRRGVTAR
jgi:hypothetical protein